MRNHDIIERSAAKFCYNCGSLIAIEPKNDEKEHCGDCGPWQRISDDAQAQIKMLLERSADASRHLNRIREERGVAIHEAQQRN